MGVLGLNYVLYLQKSGGMKKGMGGNLQIVFSVECLFLFPHSFIVNPHNDIAP